MPRLPGVSSVALSRTDRLVSLSDQCPPWAEQRPLDFIDRRSVSGHALPLPIFGRKAEIGTKRTFCMLSLASRLWRLQNCDTITKLTAEKLTLFLSCSAVQVSHQSHGNSLSIITLHMTPCLFGYVAFYAARFFLRLIKSFLPPCSFEFSGC